MFDQMFEFNFEKNVNVTKMVNIIMNMNLSQQLLCNVFIPNFIVIVRKIYEILHNTAVIFN